MDVTDQDISNLERISEEVFGDMEYLEIEEVKDTRGDVMVSVESVDHPESSQSTRNAFAGSNLRKFHESGYVAVAVGGGEDRHSAWFERADAIDFGDDIIDGKHDLSGDWSAIAGEKYIVLRHGGNVVVNVAREGNVMDTYTAHKALPSKANQDLKDIGFTESEEPLL